MNGAGAESNAALIWCPFPDRNTARQVANSLLDEGLVACVNVLTGVESVFIWNGERDASQEAGALLKTNQAKLERAIARLAELHPYEQPAIVGWKCDAASPGTKAWLGELGT